MREYLRYIGASAALLLIAVFVGCGSPTNVPARSDYVQIAKDLQKAIAHEMQDKQLPAVSIALVDDQEIVWAQGFGFSDPEREIAATAKTVYRVGSVSKLFTDIGVMQLVERGEIDLDVPVQSYLPDFKPQNGFGKEITLRQLMSHRSGLVREPPVGHYFDPTEPTLAATVASLNPTSLVYEPEKRIKYSNAGIAVVGYVLEKTQGQPFADYLARAVLAPLGLRNSSFQPTDQIRQNLAKAIMWAYDGRTFPAPTFEMGMAPAGSMHSTVLDLGNFMTVLFNGGAGPNGQVLKPETLEKMWTPQFADAGATTGFGIGFSLSELDGHRRVGHGGAIYGFATQLYALPDEKLGVVVVTSMDVANTVMSRISDHALKTTLAVRNGEPIPSFRRTDPLDPKLAQRLAGAYQKSNESIELVDRDGRLFLWRGSFRGELKAIDDTLIADDRLAFGTRVRPEGDDKLVLNDEVFRRVLSGKPSSAPARWRGLIGEYGWDHNTLFVLEKEQKLHALIEWCFLYPLLELSRDVFAFPDYGLYHGEKLIFKRNASGIATEVEAASVVFNRRPVGLEEGTTFRIKPVKPIDEVRESALAASPPKQADDLLAPDLVELTDLDPTIRLDIRYASTNNFMDAVFYQQPQAFMQRPAAEALVRVHQRLRERGYGLLIHDAYRPWYVTKMFWDATPADKKLFVANPANGSIHNRGAAVDLTLFDLKTGEPIQMVSGYDEFSERAYPDYPGGTSCQRWHRELLRDAMEAEGFEVYEWEWWHFNYKDAGSYPVLNLRFEEIEGSN